MTYAVRTEAEADYARVAELLSLGYPEPVDAAQVREWRRNAVDKGTQRHVVADDEARQVVGYAHALHDSWDGAGVFWLHVAVDPKERRHGLGDLLFGEMLAFAREHGATRLRGEVREANAEAGMPFAERHGFRVERHIFESTLDLTTFDETRFAGQVERMEEAGIHFVSLTELGNTEEAQRRLHALNERLALDNPGTSRQEQRPFEAFRGDVFEASWFRPDGQILALVGDEWVGLSAAGYYADSNSAYNMMTGVAPAYRGRGIALALKLLALRAAKGWGAAYIRTNNDSENAPMLAVNRKLGYRPELGYYRIARELERQG